MTLEDRYTIFQMLNDGSSFKKIADAINKNCSSISREIRNHLEYKKTGAYSHAFNACIHRKGCPQTSLCSHCTSTIYSRQSSQHITHKYLNSAAISLLISRYVHHLQKNDVPAQKMAAKFYRPFRNIYPNQTEALHYLFSPNPCVKYE